MKRYKYIFAGLITSVFLTTGCSDSFLEVESKTQETVDTYFTTDEHIQEAVVAAYDPLHWPDWAMSQYNPVQIMSDIMADDIWVGGADKNDNQYWHLMMNYEALPTNTMTGLWTVAYSGVKRSNDVLTYIGWAGENLTEENATYYEAQVRVLRVFYYNWLWKFWGNIPYYEQNLTAPYIAEQFSADEVYNKMIVDLEGAIALDVLPMKASSENYGRVTKAMAYMLYAEIVMYQNDESRYAKALQYMQEIINSAQYALVDDYAAIFKESGEWSSESIFEVNYKDDNAARSWNSPLVAGGTVLPRLISPSGWADGTDGHDNGWGFCPVRTETYERYSNNDIRRGATCWDAVSVGSYNPRYQDTGLFLEKYVAKTGDNKDQIADADLNYNNNLRVYRFSETLLNAAELIVRGAGSGDAKEYLNRVHKRAGLTVEVAATLDNIIEERHLEFAGEGKRYWDLIRTGKAASVLVPDSYGYRTNAWSESKKYLPIPQSEIDAAQGTLTQNNY
ncbi:RagB/SusD family nutrient uptake outer membrane protein [Massilibacteroides sp.]|uniref:RagB/SusD family nutrient uptake outer membrane protein n=1 Tax=Massilibacteroides sp. TaxID=2034766 RepID=UPI00263065AB|nr:RagB/SusD family nutrient uptake outer membrane protein [Massilibacteroides sp.]MDD4516252.1 RagB/SusD family nutrient uptake outer membrane protein [Massilibacteroides sp.]